MKIKYYSNPSQLPTRQGAIISPPTTVFDNITFGT